MTGTPSEMDLRSQLPARGRRASWLQAIDERARAEQRAAVAGPPTCPPPDQPSSGPAAGGGLHPGAGVAVLACRCGSAIDAADMHRAVPPRPSARSRGCTVIRPIVCPRCASA